MPYFVVLVGCMLVCTLGMGAMMWLMMRGMGGGNQHQHMTSPTAMDAFSTAIPQGAHLSDGRDVEVAKLRAQIDELELRNRALQAESGLQDAASIPGGTREGELAR